MIEDLFSHANLWKLVGEKVVKNTAFWYISYIKFEIKLEKNNSESDVHIFSINNISMHKFMALVSMVCSEDRQDKHSHTHKKTHYIDSYLNFYLLSFIIKGIGQRRNM